MNPPAEGKSKGDKLLNDVFKLVSFINAISFQRWETIRRDNFIKFCESAIFIIVFYCSIEVVFASNIKPELSSSTFDSLNFWKYCFLGFISSFGGWCIGFGIPFLIDLYLYRRTRR